MHLHLSRVLAVGLAAGLLAVGAGTGAVARDLLTGNDVKDRSLKGRDLATGAVASRAIDDGSIRLDDLSSGVRKELELPGVQGATGPTGPRGPAESAARMVYVDRNLVTIGGTGTWVPAYCPVGTTPVSVFVPPDQGSDAAPVTDFYLNVPSNAMMVKMFGGYPAITKSVVVQLACFGVPE